MCEIAVVDPSRTNNEAIQHLAATLSEEQGDGFGILSVQTNGDNFNYEVYKSTSPHWFTFNKFLERTTDDTWRYFLHGRAKTTGGVNRRNTHPLPVNCPECEAQWVIHNGVVRNYQQNNASLQSAGHRFATTVDSEVIAHKISELPGGLEDIDHETYNVDGSLNYFVFTPEGIFGRLTTKYRVTEDFIVSCSRRRASADAITASYTDTTAEYEWFRLTPAPENEKAVAVERKERTSPRVNNYWNNRNRSTGRAGSRAGTSSRSGSKSKGTSSAVGSSVSYDTPVSRKTFISKEQDKITEVYEDLAPGYPQVAVYKVAPGVIKVVDKETRTAETEFVFEEKRTKLYYHFARDDYEAVKRSGEGGDLNMSVDDFFDDEGNLVPAGEAGSDEKVAEAVEEATKDSLDALFPEVEGEDDDDPLGNLSVGQIALLELTGVYGDTKSAEKEMERMSNEQIQDLAKNAVHARGVYADLKKN